MWPYLDLLVISWVVLPLNKVTQIFQFDGEIDVVDHHVFRHSEDDRRKIQYAHDAGLDHLIGHRLRGMVGAGSGRRTRAVRVCADACRVCYAPRVARSQRAPEAEIDRAERDRDSPRKGRAAVTRLHGERIQPARVLPWA